jgi:hypothetical protein
MRLKNYAILVLYLSLMFLVIGALVFRNNVQGSSSDSSDNFFFSNFSIHHIIYQTHLKALISERARRYMIEYSSGTVFEFLV